jgi:peptide/nickel transport system substrate-binding protein
MYSKVKRHVFLTAALIIITGAAPLAAAQDCPGGELVVSMGMGAPVALTSAVASGYTTGMVSTQIFASPLRYDENWNPKPYLAKSWEVSKDGRAVTLHLVEGATFHDGRAITSEDVAFSVMSVKKYSPFRNTFAPIERVDTPNPQTAIIRLKHPYPVILLALSPYFMPILPKHIYGDGQDLKTHPALKRPVGSGPFKFAAYDPGKRLVLDKYGDFFIPGRPCLDRIVFNITSDQDQQMIEMERQETHLMPHFISPGNLSRLSKSDHLQITSKGYQGIGPINWLAFNLLKKPLSDKRVRQAIACAVDRKFISRFLHNGISRIATGPVAPDNPFYESDVPFYPVDLARANRLLDAAGYPRKPNGNRFTLTLDYYPPAPSQSRDVALYVQEQLRKIGIEIKAVKPKSFSSWVKRVSQWEFDMTMNILSDYGDPVLGAQRSFLSENIRKVMWSNTQNYQNARVDELLHQAAVEPDMDKRKTLYSEFQKIVMDELPVLPINVIPFHTVYHKGLRSLPASIWGVFSPMDRLYWEKPVKRQYVATPALDKQSPQLKRVGVRAMELLKKEGLHKALERFKDSNQGFLDLKGSGRHVIGFNKKGIVFLDNSGQMTPGMDMSGILDLEGEHLLPKLLSAAKGETGGIFRSKGAWPHPGTHRVGPMRAWCGMLTADDAVCAMAWDAQQGE